MTERWVYGFSEGAEDMRQILGGKGAGLAGMTAAGFPVPPGFTITTGACRIYHEEDHRFPDGMWDQTELAISAVEEATGKQFGGSTKPLLFSVRSGGASSERRR